MRNRFHLVALWSVLLSGCASCGDGSHPDADHDDRDVDSDAASDADAESDTDLDMENMPDGDAETDTEGLPAPVPVDLVEIPHDREALDCGTGCRQLTFGEPVYRYDISQDFLVYISGELSVTIFLVDLETYEEYILLSCGDHWCSSAGVDGNQIVFSTVPKNDDTNWTLWRYQMGEDNRYPLVQRRMTERARPVYGISVSAGSVAWYDSAIAMAGLYAMSISGGEVFSLTSRHCICFGDPELHGRQVVYEGWSGTSRDIWMVNVDTLEEEILVEHPAPQFDPAFDGQWVVWVDGRNDSGGDPYMSPTNSDIYGMDLETRTIRPICDHAAIQHFPDVRDGLVAWTDWRNDENPNEYDAVHAEMNIYLLELSTGREVQVTNLPGGEGSPRIWGQRVFYKARDLTGQVAIFVVDLDEAGLLEPE